MLRVELGLTRANQVTNMLRKSVPRFVVAAFLIIAVTGCEKKSGEAVVLSKEHMMPQRQLEKRRALSLRLASLKSDLWRMMRSRLRGT
jgi:hypothetical protein